MAPTARGAYEVTHRVEDRRVFDSLTEFEIGDGRHYKRYAHHLARACWHGGRITLCQTSPEAEGIFDIVLELHRACSGRCKTFCDYGIVQEDIDKWLEFAGTFLSSLGNYFVSTRLSTRDCKFPCKDVSF